MRVSSKSKNRIKKYYLIIFACVNSIAIGFIFLATLKSEVNIGKVIIFSCLIILYPNIRLCLFYFKEIRSLDSKTQTYYDLDKSGRKKYIVALLILLAVTVLGVFLIFVKGMLLIGSGIMIVNGYTFIYFHKKLLKESRKGEISND